MRRFALTLVLVLTFGGISGTPAPAAESTEGAATGAVASLILRGLLCDRAIIRIAFQSSPIRSLPLSLVFNFIRSWRERADIVISLICPV